MGSPHAPEARTARPSASARTRLNPAADHRLDTQIGYTVAVLIGRWSQAGTGRWAFAALTLVSCLGCAGVASAKPKTDVVVLKNGDRVTCEIKSLDRGLLKVSTDDMGTISIEWQKVTAVTSAARFEVETTIGDRFYGSLAPAGTDQVAVVGYTAPSVLDLRSIIRLAPLERSFWQRLYGNVGAGGSYTQSSGIAQGSFNFLLGARRPAFEWQTSLDTTVTIQEQEPPSNRYTGQVVYTRLLRNRWIVPGSLTVEQNKDLGYTLRSIAALGIGRTLVQSNRSLLRVVGGLDANREIPVDGETVTNIEAVFSFMYEFFTYDFPKTDFTTHLTAFPSLNDLGRFRFNSNVQLTRDLFTSDFYVAVTLYDDYDSRPPTADASTNDVGVTFSLGWKF